MIDLAFVVKAWADFPNNPPWGLLALTFSQVLYVADSLWYEVRGGTEQSYQAMFFFLPIDSGSGPRGPSSRAPPSGSGPSTRPL